MAIVTKANLATYLAGLTPSATPYPIEITEATALDWSDKTESPPIRTIIVNNTPPGVFLDLRTTTVPNCTYYYILVACPQLVYPPTLSEGLGIMTSCFAYCVNLKEAPVLPSTTRILQREFTDCILLTSLPVFNSGIESIQIRGCSAITQLNNLPETLLTLAISDFSSLLEVENIPASVTILGLRDCPSLITIKSFCVDVDNCSINFTGTISLESIYVPYLEESTWHLLHTDTGATGTDYTIYNPDGTVAGSGTVAGTSQVLTLYGKSDELVISANITPTLAEETATTQVQWHKSGLPYDDELMIFNAKNPTTVISNILITTLRYSASFTLPTYLDGQKIRIANTHATNTITCTLPTGQTMNGQSSFTIAPDTLLEFELIGTVWKCVSNEWEFVAEFLSASTTLNVSVAQYRKIQIILFNSDGSILSQEEAIINDIINKYLLTAINFKAFGVTYSGGVGIQISASKIIVRHNIYDFSEYSFDKTKIYGMK